MLVRNKISQKILDVSSTNNSNIHIVTKDNLQNTTPVELHEHQPPQKEALTSYLLLLALSIHACFEGIALGLQNSSNEIFYMLLAISFHKWVEALSIGVNLFKSNIERAYLCKIIILFSAMTPLGMILGMLFSGLSEIIEAVFLSISAGSFIYISASEVVIEEFSVSKYKYEKFIGFLFGACIICLMTIFEHPH